MQRLALLSFLLLSVAVVTSCGHSASTSDGLPAPSSKTVVFATDVQPILQKYCAQCHLGTAHKGNFSLTTQETALKEGKRGARIIPGDSAHSFLIERVAADKASKPMPPKGARLTPDEVAILRASIDQGAKF